MAQQASSLCSILVMVVGCGGSGGGGGRGDGGADAGVDAAAEPANCSAEPMEGAKCYEADRWCSYGDDLDLGCRTTLRCAAFLFANWTKDRAICAPEPCPTTPAPGDSCATLGQSCVYPEGTACVCADCPGGGADGGPCMEPRRFRCAAASDEPGCPAAYPHYGDRCPEDGLVCHWGPPGTCGALLSIECVDGGWHPYRGAICA